MIRQPSAVCRRTAPFHHTREQVLGYCPGQQTGHGEGPPLPGLVLPKATTAVVSYQQQGMERRVPLLPFLLQRQDPVTTLDPT